MKVFFTLLAMVAYASANDFDLDEAEADPRLFFFNFTSTLVAVNITSLTYGIIFLTIVSAAAIALYYFYLQPQSNSKSSTTNDFNADGTFNDARSADDMYDYNGLNIVQWISMLQDLYEKFDYNNLDCQKKLICEVMRDPEYYGNTAEKFKSGFRYAKYLEVLSLPDNIRELLDEYLDANSRAEQQRECEEFFQCPYSIKDSFNRNMISNNDIFEFEEYELAEDSARFLNFNSSSAGTSLTLLGAVILLGVIVYLIFVGGLLDNFSATNRNDYYNPDQFIEHAQNRSANEEYNYNGLNIIQWISLLQELYEKFDLNDLDCQKRVICEVMREPEYYGNMAQKFKSGFQYAKYLEILPLPYNMRELLDEYLDANSHAKQQTACEELFRCPYSIKDSVKRNLIGNSL